MAQDESATSEGSAILGDAAHRHSPLKEEPYLGDVRRFMGGPLGRFARAGTQTFWTPLIVVLSVASTFLALGFLSKANCLGGNMNGGVATIDWSGYKQYTSACYNDIVPLYRGRGLDNPGDPFAFSWDEDGLTRYNEYPVLAVLFMWIMSRITWAITPLVHVSFDQIPEASVYFILTAIVCAFLWLIVVRWTAQLAGNRPWDAMLVAASPVVIVHAFTNWDIPAIFLALAAIMALRKGKLGAGGILIGLGTAFKLWPLYILGAYLVVAIREKQLGRWLKTLAGAVIAWLVVNLPVMLRYPEAWREFSRLNSDRNWDWITIYGTAARQFGWQGFDNGATPPETLNRVTFVLFAVSCVAIAIFGYKVARRPRVAELLMLIVVAFLFFNKVWSPQYSLWLVPLVALAIPNWPLVFAWGVSELVLWPILTLTMLGTDNMGLEPGFLDIFVVLRNLLLLILTWQVIQQMRGRRTDKVYRDNDGQDLLLGDFLDPAPQPEKTQTEKTQTEPLADDAANTGKIALVPAVEAETGIADDAADLDTQSGGASVDVKGRRDE
ncbi:MAG: glycosyltransferase 87 family protein [Corynebacterium sp.]|nr:glycosyltransferase 87 family protein [Corynebacterium sp.]